MELAALMVEEPSFDSTPERCYKYPFVACEAFCIDQDHIASNLFEPTYSVLLKLFSVIPEPPIIATKNEVPLN